ncbi:RNA polymerase sigma factor SigF [Nocardia speluncae]|uniref:RNA polymerase sigma factor SigF n=1 Tax=Nocardia speluncae TaxID=419477 RepID=A0A846X8E5_9NOCA|nr:RNA polymerase sigma factor SigF [Nocardia speluncae]NKY31705.1 RNA polymerase sigma factor SigF [Nocardia speluncae]
MNEPTAATIDTPAAARRTARPGRAPGGDSYDNLEPCFDELARLDHDDPRRPEIRTEIVHRGLPLADHIARRFSGRGEAFDDLLQIARMGLVQAVDRFDTSRGSSFLSFAVPTIMGEVRRHFRDHTWAVRVPRGTKELHLRIGPASEALFQRLGRPPTARDLAAELGAELTEVTQALIAGNGHTSNSLDAAVREHDDETPPPAVLTRLGTEEPCYGLLEDAMAVRPLIEQLPRRERQILVWRYFGSMTQNQIAQRLGISQMQVSRILTKTLKNLREQALAEPGTAGSMAA